MIKKSAELEKYAALFLIYYLIKYIAITAAPAISL